MLFAQSYRSLRNLLYFLFFPPVIQADTHTHLEFWKMFYIVFSHTSNCKSVCEGQPIRTKFASAIVTQGNIVAGDCSVTICDQDSNLTTKLH